MIVGYTRATLDPDYEYNTFCNSVKAKTGIDLASYKRRQMERRIRSMAERKQKTDLLSFWKSLESDPAALDEFLDRVTINVSEFFRNPEKFIELRDWLLPKLLKERDTISIWSAGCSIGAEPYTMAMLLEEISPRKAHRILATDVDVRVLAKAREGRYGPGELKSVPPDILNKYFIKAGQDYLVSDAPKRRVSFQQHDLLKSSFPKEQDLILCRNVIIYFNDEAKHHLFERFAHALRPGGYLLLGNTERILNPQQYGLVQERPFFYRRSEVHR